jgi:hypothetical protein
MNINEVEQRILKGDFEYVPEAPSSLIRIFLSSTFSGLNF